MALEIERRFLVGGDGWRPLVRWSQLLQQGYLMRTPRGRVVTPRGRAQLGLPPIEEPQGSLL